MVWNGAATSGGQWAEVPPSINIFISPFQLKEEFVYAVFVWMKPLEIFQTIHVYSIRNGHSDQARNYQRINRVANSVRIFKKNLKHED
jgi:hypothetical protein